MAQFHPSFLLNLKKFNTRSEKMKKLGFFILASIVISGAYGASNEKNIDDYPFNFSCKEAQRVVNNINSQMELQIEQMQEAELPAADFLEGTKFSLNCEEAHFKIYLIGTERRTKASISSNYPLCNNVTLDSNGKRQFNLLPEEYDFTFEPSIRLLGYHEGSPDLKNIFNAQGVYFIMERNMNYTNFHLTSLALPRCF